MNECIEEFMKSSDEGLLAIGGSLLDSNSVTDEERQYWIQEYIKRMNDKGWAFESHEDSFRIVWELNLKMSNNETKG